MKIAFFAYNFVPNVGGAQVFMFNMMRHLAARGHKVVLYLPRYLWRPYQDLELKMDFEVRPLGRGEKYLAKFLPGIVSRMLLREQELHKYDLWQIIGAYPCAYVARKLSSLVPTVLRSHGDDIQKDATLGYGDRLNPRLEEKIKKGVLGMTRLVALTESVQDCYMELGADSAKITVIPNGIELSRFKEPFDRTAFRQKLGVNGEDILILTTSRNHPKKGLEYLPEAAKHLLEHGYKFKWLLLGDGVGRLAEKFSEEGLADVFILKDEIKMKFEVDASGVPQVPAEQYIHMYRAADYFAMPSLLETFGMVLIEALAAGLPVVTTNAPGCRDVIRDGVNGLQAPCRDGRGMGKCLERLITDSALRGKLAENALQDINRYDWANVAVCYEELYQRLTKENTCK
ncbi:MAG: hypothetical protein A2X49_03590 [Lentisphaerae bacterium GWF2_52_8]|nr:MAG: hypothetical protein A2X49_03590 [Lentisphaerae bacterium GWF2_52_8]